MRVLYFKFGSKYLLKNRIYSLFQGGLFLGLKTAIFTPPDLSVRVYFCLSNCVLKSQVRSHNYNLKSIVIFKDLKRCDDQSFD